MQGGDVRFYNSCKQKFVACLCAVALCLSFVPTMQMSFAFADDCQSASDASLEATTVKVKFTVTPADAKLVVTAKDGSSVSPASSASGVSIFNLVSGSEYNYTVTKEGYATYQKLIVASAGNDVTVDLHALTQADKGTVSGGSKIEQGGVYQVTDTTPGCIEVATTDKVTFTGTGFADSSKVSNIAIKATGQSSNIVIRDLFIADTSAPITNSFSLIDFGSQFSSTLSFEGTSILEYDLGYTTSNDALVRVGKGATLNIQGAGTAYLYKKSSGACIGGAFSELNGNIVFNMDGSLFAKGTKQGAVIGAGAEASSTTETPGSVTFKKGEYNLISNSRAAAIGGSAGSGGASDGTEVNIESRATININVDFSGPAIGGGGYSTGSDASGGTVNFSGGNLRMYVDKNAAENVTGKYWKGLALEEGINNVAMTAQRKNANNEDVYMAAIDTTGIDADSDGKFVVKVDEGDSGVTLFEGTLNQNYYVQEAIDRESSSGLIDTNVDRACDNWQSSVDKNIYVYLTKGTHELTVNGEKRVATFDSTKEGTIGECNGEIFTITEPAVEKVKMYRLYNKWTGEHFYTANADEQKGLVKIGWTDEGTGWFAPKTSSTPVYRLYNPYVEGGDHHYTMSADEKDACVKAGWSYEGIAWYSADTSDEGARPLYRQYNPNEQTGTHNYTLSEDEAKKVVAAGWNNEGTAWYGYESE